MAMRNIIASIYILSITVLTQTGCDKKSLPVTTPESGGPPEFETTVVLQLVNNADATDTPVAVSTQMSPYTGLYQPDSVKLNPPSR
jgi:hypothetical protein